MKPCREKYYRFLFTVSAIYDTGLGIIFTFFSRQAFQMLGIADKLPAFGGYISLLGAFLFVIGVAYFLIARGDLRRNLDLILVGVLYKLTYCATAFSYFAIGDVPHIIFVSLFGVADFIFLVFMIECFLFLKKTASVQPMQAGNQ